MPFLNLHCRVLGTVSWQRESENQIPIDPDNGLEIFKARVCMDYIDLNSETAKAVPMATEGDVLQLQCNQQ